MFGAQRRKNDEAVRRNIILLVTLHFNGEAGEPVLHLGFWASGLLGLNNNKKVGKAGGRHVPDSLHR